MFGPHDNLVHNLKGLVGDARQQATATTTGDEVALTGGAVLIAVYVDTIGTADATHYFTFSVTQATASGGSFVAADAAQYKTNLWDRIINATTETGLFMFQFIPKATYDYIKVIGTETGTADVTFSVFVIQGDIHAPVT